MIDEPLLKHWANAITFVLGVLVLMAASIPFLSYFGLDAIAKPLFFWFLLLYLARAYVQGMKSPMVTF